MPKSSKKSISEKKILIQIEKSVPTHILLNLEILQTFGWEKAVICGVLSHYGNCKISEIHEALPFLDKNRIDLLIKEMKSDGILRGNDE